MTVEAIPTDATAQARRNLVDLLQLAHSGELAASIAYAGHAASVKDPDERRRIEQIRLEELDHRARVRAMLDVLGVAPEARRERKLRRIGTLISAFCHVGGWFGPMYGAARLERKNIGEYERAATRGRVRVPRVRRRPPRHGRGRVGARALLPREVRGTLALAAVPEMGSPALEGGDERGVRMTEHGVPRPRRPLVAARSLALPSSHSFARSHMYGVVT